MTTRKLYRITAIINRGISNAVNLTKALQGSGHSSIMITSGSSLLLEEKTGFAKLFSTESSLVGDPVDVITVVVSEENRDHTMQLIASKAELNIPGHGSVYSEEVKLVKSHELCKEVKTVSVAEESQKMQTELMGINCIVQRGAGEALAKLALNTGTVPFVTYGNGTGVRDKLGLLRITIPAEKEVVTLITTEYDAETVMDLMIDAANLDQPGRGFISLFPVYNGMVNTKITSGMPKHAASLEQIISVLDEIKGGVEWRKRSAEGRKATNRTYLKGLIDMTIVCNEGRGEDLVKACMNVGASGATIGQGKHISITNSPESAISPAREICKMVVSETQLAEKLLPVLEANGAFDDKTHGQIFYSPVPKACTYLPKPANTAS